MPGPEGKCVPSSICCVGAQGQSSERFIREQQESGCRAVIYVEYVPMESGTADLALGEAELASLEEQLEGRRKEENGLLFLSFPGDEKRSGGCLAAGRGFFHINARGEAEPCPFSPYSDTSLLRTSLRDALQSPLFRRLRTEGLLQREHTGGCVLFEQEARVKELCSVGRS